MNNVIQNLNFASNPLKDDGIISLCERLQKALSLEVLSLSIFIKKIVNSPKLEAMQ